MIEGYFNIRVAWEKTDDGEYPYRARIDNHVWVIRINDFPEEELYTLLIDDEVISDFSEWPASWQR